MPNIKTVDYIDAATKLIKTLKNRYPHIVIVKYGETPHDIAPILERTVEPDLIEELIGSYVGHGILIGIVTTFYIVEQQNAKRSKDQTETSEIEEDDESATDETDGPGYTH